jgi:hypothetical protein
VNTSECVFPFHAPNGRAKCVFEARALTHEQRQQEWKTFGIGLRRLKEAERGKLVAQLAEVLEDPIVYDGNLAVRTPMRVSVLLGRAAVRRPPRVADAGSSSQGVPVETTEFRLEPRQALRASGDLQTPLGEQQTDAGAVVAAIFEPLQAIEEDRRRFSGPKVSDYSTHGVPSCVALREEAAVG